MSRRIICSIRPQPALFLFGDLSFFRLETMETSGAPPIVFPVDRLDTAGLLYLGGEPAGSSSFRATRLDGPPTAIILMSRIEPAQLAIAPGASA
jgi:hypothetical protein